MNILDVHRSLVQVCGCEPKVTQQSDGSLFVYFTFSEETALLRPLSSVVAEVSCRPHATLNQSRGVVFCRDILRYSLEKLLRDMEDGFVGKHRF